MMTLSSIFDVFGGPAEVGRAIGVSTEHATTMRRRGSIPVRYWPSLLAEARDRSITLSEADLVAIHAAPAAEPPKSTEAA